MIIAQYSDCFSDLHSDADVSVAFFDRIFLCDQLGKIACSEVPLQLTLLTEGAAA